MPSAEGLLEDIRPIEAAGTTSTLLRRNQWRLFFAGLVANDLTMMTLAFILAYIVRFEMSIPIFRLVVKPEPIFYARLILILIPVWGVIFIALGLYNRENLLGGTQEYALTFRAITYGFLLVVVAGFLEPALLIARGWLLLTWGFGFFLTAFGRFVLRRIVYFLRRRGYFLGNALIVGTNREGYSLAQQLRSWKTSGLHIVGLIDAGGGDKASVDPAQVLGTLEDLEETTRKYEVEELILATSALSRDQMLEIFKRYGVSDTINLRLSSGLFEIITTGLSVRELAFVPLVGVNKVRLTGMDKILKMLLDYGLTVPLLILGAPFMFLIGVAVKLDSKGPMIHRRRVMGVNSKQFYALKFRTMYHNSDEILAGFPELQVKLSEKHKLIDDPRVTRIGRLLRKFSLDELPQLLNVLKGEMSLVGPRMISPEELLKYNEWGINLLTVKPGITGLWQVSGRSDVSYTDRVRLDMQYIRTWTIWLDLQLLMRTIPAVINQQGAY